MTWSAIIAGIVAAFLRMVGETYLAGRRDDQSVASARAQGAAEAGNETLTTIAEISDAQARAAADAADDAGDLSRRLRARAYAHEPAGGGAPAAGRIA